ncbi:MAG: hypothetical protein WBP81_02995, partial [Solirubrobacteraceae bacterium]
HTRGRYFSIVVAAEGATPRAGTMELLTGDVDEFGHPRLGGIGYRLERDRKADISRAGLNRPSSSSSSSFLLLLEQSPVLAVSASTPSSPLRCGDGSCA